MVRTRRTRMPAHRAAPPAPLRHRLAVALVGTDPRPLTDPSLPHARTLEGICTRGAACMVHGDHHRATR